MSEECKWTMVDCLTHNRRLGLCWLERSAELTRLKEKLTRWEGYLSIAIERWGICCDEKGDVLFEIVMEEYKTNADRRALEGAGKK